MNTTYSGIDFVNIYCTQITGVIRFEHKPQTQNNPLIKESSQYNVNGVSWNKYQSLSLPNSLSLTISVYLLSKNTWKRI